MKLKYFNLETPLFILGNSSIHQLADRVGSTPFYVYDRRVIQQKIDELKRNLPKELSIHYAVKANPMSALLCFMSDLVDGFDVASANELKLALDTGMSPQKISFAGPGKTDAELKQAIAAEVLIHVESMNEIKRLHRMGQNLGITPRVSLRINPDFTIKASGMKMSGGSKVFGIDIEDIPQVVSECQKLKVSIDGLHFFSGSQNLNAHSLLDGFEKTIQILNGMKSLFLDPIKYINIGGGFGIPYFDQDQELDIVTVAKGLNQQIPLLRKNYPIADFSLELGRYLVGESGIFVAKVIDKKISRGKTFIVLDGGMNVHLAASGNLGQVIKKSFPIRNVSKLTSAKKEVLNVSGPLCTPLDTLAIELEISFVDIGDLIAVFQSGAYGLTASPQDFLSHDKVKEVLI